MSSEPFDIELVIKRIQEHVPDLREVAGREGYAAITRLSDFPTPAAYVLMADEDFNNSPDLGPVQETTVTFGVAVAVRNYRASSTESRDELRHFLGLIRDCLKGWETEDRADRIQIRKGSLVDYDASAALWVDVYELTIFNGA